MIDPSEGMKSFQKELRRGGIAIQVTKTDPNLFVHLDAPNGPPEIRFTYVRLKGKTVTAMVIFGRAKAFLKSSETSGLTRLFYARQGNREKCAARVCPRIFSIPYHHFGQQFPSPGYNPTPNCFSKMISFSNNKQYGKQLLFVDASFQMNPGEKVGVVGPKQEAGFALRACCEQRWAESKGQNSC